MFFQLYIVFYEMNDEKGDCHKSVFTYDVFDFNLFVLLVNLHIFGLSYESSLLSYRGLSYNYYALLKSFYLTKGDRLIYLHSETHYDANGPTYVMLDRISFDFRIILFDCVLSTFGFHVTY